MKLSLCGKGINKEFPGVKACNNVDFKTYHGRATGLIGVNGAGKSTLMNIIAGEVMLDSGVFTMDEKEVQIKSPVDAMNNGIALIHQEAVVFPTISVAENLFIKVLKRYISGGKLQRAKMNKDAQEILDRVGCTLKPGQMMSLATTGERQLIEIGRALAIDAEVFLFDEPTSSLSAWEKECLFNVIRDLKKLDKTIIYITHFIDEVKEICEDVVVMRDGNVVGSRDIEEVDVPELIQMMVGFSVEKVRRQSESRVGDPVLKVSGLTRHPKINNVSFELRKGEILGIWGLMGSGRTETLRAMLGLDRPDSGSVSILNEKGQWKTMRGIELLDLVGYVTENRNLGGIFGNLPIWKNITLPNLKHYNSGLFINEAKEHEEARRQIEVLQIKTPDENVAVGTLSGGNQQKVIMARWLSKGPRFFLLDEPTRGIDVNSKNFIYQVILDLVERGCSIILVSSEIEEIIDLSDRVVILSDGEVVDDNVVQEDINKINLMRRCVERGDITA